MNPRRVAWLLGAGASAAAGLPTASQIRDDLLLRVYAERHNLVRQNLHPNDPSVRAALDQYFNGRNGMAAFGADDDYSRAFELALPDEGSRAQYLQNLGVYAGMELLGELIAHRDREDVVRPVEPATSPCPGRWILRRTTLPPGCCATGHRRCRVVP